jgi:lipoprotein-anchoring transpeptidase ErfK/SrfK
MLVNALTVCDNRQRSDLGIRIMRVSWRRISSRTVSTGFWQIAVVAAAGTFGAVSHADAALYYWQDPDPSYYRPAPPVMPPRQRSHRRSTGKTKAVEKQTGAKPQGPLIIAVSIDKQKVRIFDDNGVFAEAPVSTGMQGHPTPTGVFSVIQKHKFHHSNIYSGAPMPYMQRITWSGVAMHAGVLPGYPASHGCIRMPTSFAVKMWNWTRMGARVFVTPGDIMTPVSFSHPLLATMKVVPQPVAADEPPTDKPLAVKADKGAPEAKPASAETKLELRSSVGHVEDVKPAATETADITSLRDQTHTADAGGNARAAKTPVTMSDALARSNALAAAKDGAAVDAGDAVTVHGETVAVDNKPVETKAKQGTAETKIETTNVEIKPKAADAEMGKPNIAKPDTPKAEINNAGPAKSEAKPDDKVKPAAITPDASKDQSRPAGIRKTVVARPEAPKRTGLISVLISRKDSKLYVRQNFAPLFDVPITIAASDRPLGTHVFTVETDKDDSNILHWSVVSLPMSARSLQRNQEDERFPRRRKAAAARPVETKPLPVPDSPTEALDRVSIPADAMARITEALTTGASIIVSDQGINQGETGEGTDFIVSLR